MEAIQIARGHEPWRVEFMQLQEKIAEGYEEGFEQGIAQGMAKQQAADQAIIKAGNARITELEAEIAHLRAITGK